MARDSTGVKKVGEDAPSWLVEAARASDTSLSQVKQYRQLARAKIIQGSSRTPALKQRFGEGSVVMMPGERLVAKLDQPFLFVPLFFFTEFVQWGDLDDPATAAVQERSFDEKSEVARRARDAKLRSEVYGDPERRPRPFAYRYVEHLCFVGYVYGDHELVGSNLTVGFEKGEFFRGTDFCSAILLRKVKGLSTPLWSQVWEFKTRTRNRKGYTWYGFDFGAPPDAEPFIREDEAELFRSQHEELQKQYLEKALVVERDDGLDDASVSVPSGGEM